MKHVLFYHLWECSCKISAGLAKGLSPFLKNDYGARFLRLQAPRHERAKWSNTVIILLTSISFIGEITVWVFINTTIVTNYRKNSIHRYEDAWKAFSRYLCYLPMRVRARTFTTLQSTFIIAFWLLLINVTVSCFYCKTCLLPSTLWITITSLQYCTLNTQSLA